MIGYRLILLLLLIIIVVIIYFSEHRHLQGAHGRR